MEIPKKKLNDGVEIPILGFGTWQLEGEKCVNAVKMALELGYRHIDGAYAYWNHKQVGEGIGSFPRENFFMTSKLWRDFHSPDLVEKCLDETLKDLKMDYIDLFLIHWPERKKSISSILEQMYKLKDKGKIRSIGVCNATIHHIQDIYSDGLTISNNQIEYHPFFNQNDVLEFCKKQNIAVTGYSPIAQGAVFRNETIKKIASDHNKTPAQVSLKWLIQKDIIVIPKGSSKDHISENLNIFDFKLTDDEMVKIEQLHSGKRRIHPDFNEFDY
jgi:diketogulonate reductase-like aldo/keto reductase